MHALHTGLATHGGEEEGNNEACPIPQAENLPFLWNFIKVSVCEGCFSNDSEAESLADATGGVRARGHIPPSL
jgi:hypothetical protein